MSLATGGTAPGRSGERDEVVLHRAGTQRSWPLPSAFTLSR